MAAASLETVERALGDLRVGADTSATVSARGAHGHGGRGGGGGRRGRGPRPDAAEHIKVPTTDFDFESSNAKFDKAALSPGPGGVNGTSARVPRRVVVHEEHIRAYGERCPGVVFVL